MNKEGNLVGKRGRDALHFECRNKAMGKIKRKRVSMWKKHLNRIKAIQKRKEGENRRNAEGEE